MKSNKVRMTLAAVLVGLSMVAGACASQSDPYRFVNEDMESTSSAAIQPVTESDRVIGGDSSTYTTTHRKPSSNSPGSSMADRPYLKVLDDHGLGHIPDDLAFTAATATCGFLEEGNSPEQLFNEIAGDLFAPDIITGIDNIRELPYVMGAANGAYCPHLG